MGLFGSRLFAKLSESEKHQALDLDDFYLQSILDARKGKAKMFDQSGCSFVEKLTDNDIKTAIPIIRLQKKAIAASDRGDHQSAIKLFQEIVTKVPFDSISMMSLGVQYAMIRKGKEAIKWLEKAVKSDPTNQRIRENLDAVRAEFR